MNRRQWLRARRVAAAARREPSRSRSSSASAGAAPTRARCTGFHDEYFPNLELRTQDGDRVRLYDDLLKGKTVLIEFLLCEL